MSGVMAAAQKLGLMGHQPPKHIAERAFRAAGVRRTEVRSNVAASVAHLGFGTSAGALYGRLEKRLNLERWPVAAPVAFAGGIWFVSYRGWVPAAGILPPPESDRPGRPISMILAHLAYGVVLGLVLRKGSRTGRSRTQGQSRSERVEGAGEGPSRLRTCDVDEGATRLGASPWREPGRS